MRCAVDGGKQMALRNRWVLFSFCTLLALALSACPKKQIKKNVEEPKTEEEEAKEEEDIESEELDIRGKEFASSKDMGTIYFDYDSSDLTEASRKTLADNAEFLKKNSDLEILSEGHCDERGTIGYNLALGQKRAIAVRKYYLSLGIKPKRIGSLSYGKEKPVCAENSEECWAKNRRVETKIHNPKAAENEKKQEENKIEK